MDRIEQTTLATTAALVALICVGTLWPHPLVSNHFMGSDKIQHALGFGSLVVPAGLFRPRWLRIVAPAAVLLGGAIEIIQAMIGRDGDIHDFLADSLGIALALAVCALLRPQLRRLRPEA